MNWKSLFNHGKNLSVDAAKKYLKEHDPAFCQLLDVRQHKEYEQEHIPGAILIPVRELHSRMDELDKNKPTLVYCRTGVRSKAGCQILQGQGFEEVYNVLGGIRAWKGFKIHGSETKGMEFFVPGEFVDVFHMAYRMEEGLKQFYLALVDRVAPQDQKNLLKHMAHFEDGHKAKLLHQFKEMRPDIEAEENFSAMEGGFDKDYILASYGSHLEDIEDIIHLGMMFETQAFDLYSRLARKEDNPKTRNFYEHMAKEEIAHLGQLTRELDRILAGQKPGKYQQ